MRIVIGILAGCLLWTITCMGCRSGEPASGSNLVIVLVDTLRADHVGYQGYERNVTPRLDGLRGQSIAFINHYSHSSRTGPAVASIFTGLHPRSHGVINPITEWDAKGTLGDDQETLAELLQRRGYHTFGFVGNYNVSARFGFHQGFDDYDFIESTRAIDINERALAKLSQTREPFFCYLHYVEPHSPYAAPKRYRQLFQSGPYRGPITGSHQQLNAIVAGKLVPNIGDLERLKTLYDQDIRYVDDLVWDVIETLRSREFFEDSVFVFIADHGEELGDHGSALHGYSLYEEQLRVPLFISAPGFRNGGTVETITRHADILPTLLELLDIDEPVDVQGTSLVSLMKQKEAEKAVGPVYAQVSLKAVKTVQGKSFMQDGYKLIILWRPEKKEELYHLDEDPGELHNLIYTKPEIAVRMRAAMEEFEQTLEVGEGGEVTLTPTEIKRLRSLGYMN